MHKTLIQLHYLLKKKHTKRPLINDIDIVLKDNHTHLFFKSKILRHPENYGQFNSHKKWNTRGFLIPFDGDIQKVDTLLNTYYPHKKDWYGLKNKAKYTIDDTGFSIICDTESRLFIKYQNQEIRYSAEDPKHSLKKAMEALHKNPKITEHTTMTILSFLKNNHEKIKTLQMNMMRETTQIIPEGLIPYWTKNTQGIKHKTNTDSLIIPKQKHIITDYVIIIKIMQSIENLISEDTIKVKFNHYYKLVILNKYKNDRIQEREKFPFHNDLNHLTSCLRQRIKNTQTHENTLKEIQDKNNPENVTFCVHELQKLLDTP